MMLRKLILVAAVLLAVCAIVPVWLFCGAPIESGSYSAPGGYWMRASESEIVLGKGKAGFASLKNTTRVWPVVDPDDEKRVKYVIRVADDGSVKLVRKENPPFPQAEIVFGKDD